MNINYPLLQNFLLLLLEALFLLGVVISLHRVSYRFGLAPLIVVLGGLTGALQSNALGNLVIESGNTLLDIDLGSYVLLPVILVGLLLIYVVNGTIRLRSAFLGVIALSTLVVVYKLGTEYLPSGFVIEAQTAGFRASTIRGILASMITFTADMLILTITYQAISNLLNKHPSWQAALVSILVVLWIDALVYPVIAFYGEPGWKEDLFIHVIGKSISAVAVWPLLGYYISRVSPVLPETAANISRPALNIFLRNIDIEARARFHHSLLITISKIHQLILTSDSKEALLQETCEILIRRRNYDAVTIATPSHDTKKLTPTFHSSQQKKGLPDSLFEDPDSPPVKAWFSGKLQTAQQFGRRRREGKDLFARHNIRCKSMVCLPMIHARHSYGVIILCTSKPHPLPDLELEWLQIIADDLAYAHHSLQEHQNRLLLQSAVETLQDGLMITDTEGTIEYINQSIERITGISRSELIGENTRKLFPPNLPEDLLREWRQTLTDTGSLQLEQKFTHPDGRQVYTTLNASVVKHNQDEPRHFAANFHDITSLYRYENQLLTLHKLTTDLVQIHDPDQLYRTILESSERLLDADASIIYLMGSDERSIIQTLNHNVNPEYTQRITTDYSGLPGETARRTLRPVTVNDTLNSPDYGERIHFMADFGIRALMIIPIIFQEKLIGALTVYYQQPHAFPNDVKQLGLILAQTLAIIVENTRLYQAELEQREFSEALAQAAIILNSSLELPNVLDLILEQAKRVIPCRAVNLMFLEENQLVLAGHRGYGEDYKILRQLINKVDSRLTPSLMSMKETGKPIIISDTDQENGWVELSGTQWIRSYAAAPLIINTETVGFLNVDSDKPGQFTEETIPHLEAFAAHAAVAMQNARLYQELQEYATTLEASVDARTSELQEAQQALEGILSSVSDAVFLLDTDNEIIQANQAAQTLRLQAQSLGIQLFSDIFLEKLHSEDTPSEEKIIDINSQAYQAVSSHIYDRDERLVGQIVIFRDVTRFRELDQLKSKFVSDVSHELRTPLTNMTLYLGLLQVAGDEKRQARYLETLQRETDRLTDLIEDLLTISRLEAGRVEIAMQFVDTNILLSDLVNDRSIFASQKEIRLLFRPERRLSKISADPRLLTQALSNLITNAIHYTPVKGKILVRTQTQTREEKKFVTICVQDTGYGINPDEMPMIFDRFYRGEASHKTDAPGTGLGLAIAEEIISQFNGWIEVESSPGKGSTFTVWIPVL